MRYAIEIREPNDIICSCNSCGARNYDNPRFPSDDPIIDKLYDIKIGSFVNRLCPVCMGRLASDIQQILL